MFELKKVRVVKDISNGQELLLVYNGKEAKNKYMNSTDLSEAAINQQLTIFGSLK
jgi:hypothetical protein